jgi:hypothetical protein
MVMSVREALARVVDIFGPQASWDPTKMYGNVMVSPSGNLVIHNTVDDGSGATVQVTGQVKTQSLAIDYGTNYSTLYFNNTNKNRWTIYKENTTESGSNAGSNFGLNAVADDGTIQTQVIGINRASFLTTFYKSLSILGNVSTAGYITQQVTAATDCINFMSAPNAHYKGIYFQTSGSARWLIMSDNTSESGSNAGSNFYLGRYSDSGTWIDNVIQITRSNALTTFTGALQSTNIGSGTGVYRATGDNGTSWGNWNGSSTTSLQVDCANPQSAYMGLRWTQWGSRHLAAISGYAGGSTSSTCMINFAFGSNANSHMFYDGGTATFAGALTQNSDYRIKTNVAAMEPAEVLARVLKLQPKEYDRHDHEHHLHGRQAGFIAHEVQEHFPLLVKGEKDAMKKVKRQIGDTTVYEPGKEPEDYEPPVEVEEMVPDLQSVNYIALGPYLVSAIQALNDKIDAQANEIVALKAALKAKEA